MIIDINDTIINNIKVKKYSYNYNGIKDYCYVEKGESNNYIVNFHGHGSLADQLYTREDIFTLWYPALKSHKLGIINFNTQGNGWMNENIAISTHQMINFLKKEYNINKLIILGGSMGGTSTLIYTLYYPNDMDGIIANCPASNMTCYFNSILVNTNPILDEIRDTIKDRYNGTPEESEMYAKSNANEKPEIFTMPMYLCHGNADELIPFKFSEKLINSLKNKENFMYKIIENGDHDSPLYYFVEELDWICKKLNI